MSTNPRDTQFKTFAGLLVDELRAQAHMAVLPPGSYDLIERLIAQRVYDLVQHTIGYSLEYLHECGHELSGGMGKRIVPTIPDITNWPED